VKTFKLGAYMNINPKNSKNEDSSDDSYILKFDSEGINIQLIGSY